MLTIKADDKPELDYAEFNLRELLQRVVNVMSVRIGGKRLTFKMSYDDSIPAALFGDSRRITAAIINLLGDTVETAPEDGSVILKAHLVKDADDWSVIEVTASEASRNSEISFTVIAEHVNESNAANENDNAAARERRLREERFRDITGIFAGRRILLAEDSETNRERFKMLLSPTGLDITCASNGAEAARMFSAAPGKYDLILMDTQMPILDGFDAAELIRALKMPAAKAIPIIAMISNAFTENKEKCLAAGMNGCVEKPIDIDDVVGMLDGFFRKAT